MLELQVNEERANESWVGSSGNWIAFCIVYCAVVVKVSKKIGVRREEE